MKYHTNKLKLFFYFLLFENVVVNVGLIGIQIYQNDSFITSGLILILLSILIVSSLFDHYFSSKFMCFLVNIILLILIVYQIDIYKSQKINIYGNFSCNEKNIQKVFRYNNEDYYTNCSLAKIKVLRDKEMYSLIEFSSLYKEKRMFLIRKLKLKSNIDQKIIIELSDDYDSIKYVTTNFDTEYFLYGIDKVRLIYDGVEYELGNKDYPLSVEKFLNVEKIEKDYNVLYNGEFYNMISCINKDYDYARSYIFPSSRKIENIKDFCLEMENNNINKKG